MTQLSFQTHFWPEKEDLEPIQRGLHAYNLAHLGQETINNYHPFVINARNSKDEVVGGIHAELCWKWMYVRDFWVAESERGHGLGRRLLQQAEETVCQKGFYKSHLETTEYQVRDFYLKCGYVIFGELPESQGTHLVLYEKGPDTRWIKIWM